MRERVNMRTKKGSRGLEGALHITPNTLRMLGTGDHSITPYRLEHFDTSIWRAKNNIHARIRIFDQLAEAESHPVWLFVGGFSQPSMPLGTPKSQAVKKNHALLIADVLPAQNSL